MNIFIAYLVTLIPFLVLDGIWILLLAKNFYATQLGFLFTKSVNIVPIVFFYPLYALATLFLVVMPAVTSSSWTEALWKGALLGLAAYGAYDLTNHATISGWPTLVTLVDIAWGVFVTASASVLAYFFILAIK